MTQKTRKKIIKTAKRVAERLASPLNRPIPIERPVETLEEGRRGYSGLKSVFPSNESILANLHGITAYNQGRIMNKSKAHQTKSIQHIGKKAKMKRTMYLEENPFR